MVINYLKTFNCTKFLFFVCGCSSIENVSPKLSTKQKTYFLIMLLMNLSSLYLLMVNKSWHVYNRKLSDLLVFLSAYTFNTSCQLSIYSTRLKLPRLSPSLLQRNVKSSRKWHITQSVFFTLIFLYVQSWIRLDINYVIPKIIAYWTWFEIQYVYMVFFVPSYIYSIWLHVATLNCYFLTNSTSKQLKSIQFEPNPLTRIYRTFNTFKNIYEIFSVFESIFLVDVVFSYWHLCTGIFGTISYKIIYSFFALWIVLAIFVVILIVECFQSFVMQV